MSTVGILVNPRSGSDVRRLLTSAGSSTIEDKVSILRRLGQTASLRVVRGGPRVIDVGSVVLTGARTGAFEVGMRDLGA